MQNQLEHLSKWHATLTDNTSGRYLGTKGRQNRDQSLPKFCSHKCQICRAEINCIMCAWFQDNTTYTDTWNYPSLKRTHTHIYIYIRCGEHTYKQRNRMAIFTSEGVTQVLTTMSQSPSFQCKRKSDKSCIIS